MGDALPVEEVRIDRVPVHEIVQRLPDRLEAEWVEPTRVADRHGIHPEVVITPVRLNGPQIGIGAKRREVRGARNHTCVQVHRTRVEVRKGPSGRRLWDPHDGIHEPAHRHGWRRGWLRGGDGRQQDDGGEDPDDDERGAGRRRSHRFPPTPRAVASPCRDLNSERGPSPEKIVSDMGTTLYRLSRLPKYQATCSGP